MTYYSKILPVKKTIFVLMQSFAKARKGKKIEEETPERTMAENTASCRSEQLKNWTRITILNLNFLSPNSLFFHPTISYYWS